MMEGLPLALASATVANGPPGPIVVAPRVVGSQEAPRWSASGQRAALGLAIGIVAAPSARRSRPALRSVATAMSPITAKLIAQETIAKVKATMDPTPTSWLTTLDERGHARRYLQTLRYLETCYGQALKVLPLSKDPGMKQVQQLFAKLRDVCATFTQDIAELLDEPQEELVVSVPKFYYTELRSKMDCMLPDLPGELLDEEGALRLLCCEVLGCLRNSERSFRLASERGQEVPAEVWEKKGQDAQKVASDITATLIAVFGEDVTEKTLRACVQEEKLVCEEMLDGTKGKVRFGVPSIDEDEDEEEDDEEGDGDFCTVDSKPIFIVSDCTGESAEKTVLCSLGQFGHCFDRSTPANITTHRFVTKGKVEKIVQKAKDLGAFIVFTLVEPTCNMEMVTCCEKLGVEYHDLWSGLLNKLEGYLHTVRQGVAGRRQFADERYMQMVECIEYTRTLDDGVQPHRWKEADIMVLGPSRSGKTPLSFFMAQRGYKVANYPLVPDEAIPKEVWELDQNRVFALDIDPQKLVGIRNTRMKALKMGSKTSYAQISKVQAEIQWCRNLYRKNPKWTVLDTSDSGIEESSARILRHFDEVGLTGNERQNTENPSAI